ncbi:MAG: M28 family peptidase [Candidatus Hydrogenedentes bacterium]|nr:M28 family peptidase [Candidatus Hydrogenedentota bacterium]
MRLDIQQIKDDLMFLAGRLLHRGAQTADEREAAKFIQRRLEPYTVTAGLEDFETHDNFPFLFSSYYSEFFVVALLAHWAPLLGLVYGLVILGAYLAEFTGYRGLSRFLPQFESQNVVARTEASAPRHLFVVTAYYDSGCASPLTDPLLLPRLRLLHHIVLLAIVLLLATCVLDSIGQFQEVSFALTIYVRWATVVFLLFAAFMLYYLASQGEDIRGANSNASGVAAMLRLAEKLHNQPLHDADVWFVAPGSHEAWMSGMAAFLRRHRLPRRHTYMLNLEGVGAGRLNYTTAEGLLQRMPCSPKMVQAARAAVRDQRIVHTRLHSIPTGVHTALARGYNAISIIGLDPRGVPPHWNQITDRITEVDEESIAQAADFAEETLRQLEKHLKHEGASTPSWRKNKEAPPIYEDDFTA